MVDNDEIVDVHHALADTRGRRENAIAVQPDGDIAIVGGDPALLIDEPADIDNILAQLALAFCHSDSKLYQTALLETVQ